MIEVENVIVVEGPMADVARYVKQTTETGWVLSIPAEDAPICLPFPHLAEAHDGVAEATLNLSTTWYPATPDVLAASVQYPSLGFATEFTASHSRRGSGVAYGEVDIQAGKIGDWDYSGAAGRHEGRGDDCPMPWWTWTGGAVEAWCKNINAPPPSDE